MTIHICNNFDYCKLEADKPMQIWFCGECKKVMGYLVETEDKYILKLSGEAVTGFKQNEYSPENKPST